MPQKTRRIPLAIIFLLTSAFLFATQFLSPPAQAGASRQSGATGSQSEDPIALIKSIAVNRADKIDAALSEVKVKRSGGTEEPGRANMALYPGDEVATGSNAQLTILYLDNPQEKDNEVLLDANTTVLVGSLDAPT